jgi:hypothetical protein
MCGVAVWNSHFCRANPHTVVAGARLPTVHLTSPPRLVHPLCLTSSPAPGGPLVTMSWVSVQYCLTRVELSKSTHAKQRCTHVQKFWVLTPRNWLVSLSHTTHSSLTPQLLLSLVHLWVVVAVATVANVFFFCLILATEHLIVLITKGGFVSVLFDNYRYHASEGVWVKILTSGSCLPDTWTHVHEGF